MQQTIDDHEAWREVPADEVPVNATVRYDDRGERLVGTVVDELATPGATALVVLDADGAPRVVPTEARLEMRVSEIRISEGRVDEVRVSEGRVDEVRVSEGRVDEVRVSTAGR